MAESVLVPGGRDVRGRLDAANEDSPTVADVDLSTTAGEVTSACVVACPPHPQQGGDRRDTRLRWASEALQARGIDCLRFDYGPWDEGRAEQADALNAVDWTRKRYERVSLFGYSFGATVALLAAAGEHDLACVSALAPPSRFGEGQDAVAAIERTEAPLQVLVGEQDDTVDWEPVATRARERGATVETIPADHSFIGYRKRVAEGVASFVAGHCGLV